MLLDAGAASIEAFDPAANDTFRAALGDDGGRVRYHDAAAGALTGCQAAILATDWPEFRTLGETVRKLCAPPFLFMDGRRLCRHDYAALETAGYAILAVGSPFRGKRFS
jgi:UDPglucose 6-dehydrogenase